MAYKIPRTDIKSDEVKELLRGKAGIYFLVGKSNKTNKRTVYIGQGDVGNSGEGVIKRLIKQLGRKDYWYVAIVITTTSDNRTRDMGATELKYLENCFCKLAVDAKRYTVLNKNDPSSGNASYEDECLLEDFVDYSKLLMWGIGYKIFKARDEQDKPLLIMGTGMGKAKQKITAKGRQTSEGFVVLKGSNVRDVKKSLRSALVNARKLARISKGILKEDYLLSSPSAAASFVMGSPQNGLKLWHTEDGKMLRDAESEKTGDKSTK
jgi:hypothetical protein